MRSIGTRYPRGGSAAWLGDGPAATLLRNAFFGVAPAPAGVTGSLNATEAGADIAALSGGVLVSGALAATESGSDTAVIAGGAPGSVVGGLSATEATSDTATASGRVLVQGTLSAQEVGGDTADITNVVAIAPDEPAGFAAEIDLRRWYVRRGKRLHIFDRAEDADAFLDAERQAADAVAQAQKTSRRARKRLRAKLVPTPAQTIDVDQLTRWAAEFNLDANLPALMARQDYARIDQLMAAAWAMQDERDVEELLLLSTI